MASFSSLTICLATGASATASAAFRSASSVATSSHWEDVRNAKNKTQSGSSGSLEIAFYYIYTQIQGNARRKRGKIQPVLGVLTNDGPTFCHQCNQDLEIKSHKCSTAIRRIMNTLRYNVQRPHSSRFGSVLINIFSFCRRLATFFLAQSCCSSIC